MRLLIVDDEPLERAALTRLCQSRGDFSHMVTAASGAEALAMMHENPPDIVLLECELNDMTGFDVLAALRAEERPVSIMVATDERHAARAFESNAIDYLTKPVAVERFEMTLKRVRALTQPDASADADLASESDGPPQRGLQHVPSLGCGDLIVGERAGRFYFVAPSDVDYIETNGNYVTIHSGCDKYINRDSLKRLAPLLEPCGFVRISRSIALNMRQVNFAERSGPGVLRFTLESGVQLVSSAGYRLGAGAKLDVVRRRRTPIED